MLRETIEKHPEVMSSDYGIYPDFHRIADICIGSKCYRVCRQISEGEKITLSLIDEPISDVPGVPIWLEAEKLKEWARSEEDDPSQGPIDWEQYR